jgi:hypothetical protein
VVLLSDEYQGGLMSAKQKIKPWRCKGYTEWMRSLPCRVTMNEGVDCHHIINVLPGSTGGKVADIFAFPIGRESHSLLHSMGGRAFEKRAGINQSEEALYTINQALEQGLITIIWNGDE